VDLGRLSVMSAAAPDRARGWMADNAGAFRALIDADRGAFFQRFELVALAASHSEPAVRDRVRLALMATPLPDDTSAKLARALCDALLSDRLDAPARERLSDTLRRAMPGALRALPLHTLDAMARDPRPDLQILSAVLLTGHVAGADDLPYGLIDALFSSKHRRVRAAGWRLLGELSPNHLFARRDLLVELWSDTGSGVAERRRRVRDLLVPLVTREPRRGAALLFHLVAPPKTAHRG
jgi:hypothetical protein